MKATPDGIKDDLFKTRNWNPAICKRPSVKAHGLAAATFRSHTSRTSMLSAASTIAARTPCSPRAELIPGALVRGEQITARSGAGARLVTSGDPRTYRAIRCRRRRARSGLRRRPGADCPMRCGRVRRGADQHHRLGWNRLWRLRMGIAEHPQEEQTLFQDLRTQCRESRIRWAFASGRRRVWRKSRRKPAATRRKRSRERFVEVAGCNACPENRSLSLGDRHGAIDPFR